MVDRFDSPEVEVQKYSVWYLRYMLTLKLSDVLRAAIQQELRRRAK